MSKSKLFFLTVAVTTCTLLAIIYVANPDRRLVATDLKPITGGLFVTSQLKPENIPFLRRRVFIQTIVDIRPDGEEIGQPSSAEIESEANKLGMAFRYIPVPHGPIPPDAVHQLAEVLSSNQRGRALLYCRTGNRAVRTYALVEASRPNGPDADTIIATVRRAGFSADDLHDEITGRIAKRDRPPTDHP